MLTWRIHILILYLPQSITNKSHLICSKSVRVSCTCSSRDSLWCNLSPTVFYTRYVLLGGNFTQSPTFPLVCNDGQCQKPLTVNLVMRSVLKKSTQPTQHCYPLYGLELNYTYWLHQLCGPSCHCLPHRVAKDRILP